MSKRSERLAKRQQKTQGSNRDEFPECAKIIDRFRETFGEVFVLRVEENGKEKHSREYERIREML